MTKSRSILCLSLVSLLSACSSTQTLRSDFYTPPPAQAARSLKVALVVPPSASEAKTDIKASAFTLHLTLQPALSQAVQAAAGSVADVETVADPSEARDQDLLVSFAPDFPKSVGLVVRNAESGKEMARFGPVSLVSEAFKDKARAQTVIMSIMFWNPFCWMIPASDPLGPAAVKGAEEALSSLLSDFAKGLQEKGWDYKLRGRSGSERYAAEVEKGNRAFESGRAPEAFKHYTLALQSSTPGSPDSAALYDRYLSIAAGLDSLPPVPEEAKRHAAHAQAFIKMAQDQSGYDGAIGEMKEAILTAPWWAGAYFNLGLIQESAKRYSDAVVSLNRYLKAAPNAENAKAVQQKIYELEVARDQAH